MELRCFVCMFVFRCILSLSIQKHPEFSGKYANESIENC